MWGLLFDRSQLVNGLVFDVIIAFVITYINFLIATAVVKRHTQKKFDKAAGKYMGYQLTKDGAIDPVPISRAEIEYKGKNHLFITLTHPPDGEGSTWEGDITMEMESFGVIGWRYVKRVGIREQDRPWYGFKRIMVREFPEEIHVYLIGDKSEGFGNELLIRKKVVTAAQQR